jgi:hypothetical protein|nr:MAG TPA: hypothetical protein [Caudoviricetes sp.]
MFKEKLNNIIINEFSTLFFLEEKKDEYILFTPQFLNDGSFIYFYIKNSENKIFFSNDMYKYVEPNIKKIQKNKNVIKDYFLNKKTFDKLIKSIENEGINYSLLMEKEIPADADLKEEIGKYLMTISKYYNYIYDYSIIYNKDKEIKEKEFKIAIENFVKEFNEINKKKIIKLKEKLYDKIDYFEYDDTAIFTGILTELDLHQAFGELEKKVEANNNLKALILIDKAQNNLVKYIDEKFLKIHTQDKVKIIYNNQYIDVPNNIKNFIGVSKNEIQ